MCTDKKLLFGFIIHFPSGAATCMHRKNDENGKMWRIFFFCKIVLILHERKFSEKTNILSICKLRVLTTWQKTFYRVTL